MLEETKNSSARDTCSNRIYFGSDLSLWGLLPFGDVLCTLAYSVIDRQAIILSASSSNHQQLLHRRNAPKYLGRKG